MKSVLTALAFIVAPGVASAAELSLNSALEGATLSDGRVDMSVYFTNVEADFEVVATYVTQTNVETPSRLTMVLADGDSVSFGLPGVSGKVYTFSRDGDVLDVDASNVWTQVAGN